VESVRDWARGLFLLAIFSSTVMLLVPKSMTKQVKFVSELLLLICVIAPLAGLVRSGSAVGLPTSQVTTDFASFSLGEFYAKETAQRVRELGEKAGLSVESVEVRTKDGGLSLDEVSVVVAPGASPEELGAFREAIGIYAGIPEDKVMLTARNP
jgi:hypothetical protein